MGATKCTSEVLEALQSEHLALESNGTLSRQEFVSGIKSGTCESHGLKTITSRDDCAKATAGTGLPLTYVHEASTPPGCWGVRGKAENCFNNEETPVACS